MDDFPVEVESMACTEDVVELQKRQLDKDIVVTGTVSSMGIRVARGGRWLVLEEFKGTCCQG